MTCSLLKATCLVYYQLMAAMVIGREPAQAQTNQDFDTHLGGVFQTTSLTGELMAAESCWVRKNHSFWRVSPLRGFFLSLDGPCPGTDGEH